MNEYKGRGEGSGERGEEGEKGEQGRQARGESTRGQGGGMGRLVGSGRTEVRSKDQKAQEADVDMRAVVKET